MARRRRTTIPILATLRRGGAAAVVSLVAAAWAMVALPAVHQIVHEREAREDEARRELAARAAAVQRELAARAAAAQRAPGRHDAGPAHRHGDGGEVHEHAPPTTDASGATAARRHHHGPADDGPGAPSDHGDGSLEHLAVALHGAPALPVLPAPAALDEPPAAPSPAGVTPRRPARPNATRGPPPSTVI